MSDLHRYDCNIGYGDPNIIVIALAKVVGKPEELSMHAELKEYKLKVENRKGTGYWTELFPISTKVYDIFANICKESKNKFWESTDYVLDDDNYESWKEESL